MPRYCYSGAGWCIKTSSWLTGYCCRTSWLMVLLSTNSPRPTRPTFDPFQPSPNPPPPNATKAATIFHFLWLPTIQCIMRWIKGASMTKAGKSPRWTGTVVWALFNAMWLHHDWIHARLWVRGDGRLESEAWWIQNTHNVFASLCDMSYDVYLAVRRERPPP